MSITDTKEKRLAIIIAVVAILGIGVATCQAMDRRALEGNAARAERDAIDKYRDIDPVALREAHDAGRMRAWGDGDTTAIYEVFPAIEGTGRYPVGVDFNRKTGGADVTYRVEGGGRDQAVCVVVSLAATRGTPQVRQTDCR